MARDTHKPMENPFITLLTIKMILPGCSSLKEKRGRIKPILHRLHKEFNVSVAEIGLHDIWQSTVIACVVLSTDSDHNSSLLNHLLIFLEDHFTDVQVLEHHIESY